MHGSGAEGSVSGQVLGWVGGQGGQMGVIRSVSITEVEARMGMCLLLSR